MWSRGWRIADGRPIVAVEKTFIGFAVPAGRQLVTLEYAPRSFGLSLAVMAAAILLGAATLGRSRVK